MAYNEIGDKGYVSYTAVSNQTYGQVLNSLYSLMDITKISHKSYITFSGFEYSLLRNFEGNIIFCGDSCSVSNYFIETLTLSPNSGSTWISLLGENAKTPNIKNYTSVLAPAGRIFMIYY